MATGPTTATTPSRRWWRPRCRRARPPRRATSTGASANAAKAMPVSTSKKDSGTPWRSSMSRCVRGNLLVQGDELFRGQGLAVDADPLAHRDQVRAGEAAGAQAALTQQGVDHARGGGLAVGAGDVDDREGALRIAEQADEGGYPVQGRLDRRLRRRPTISRSTSCRVASSVTAGSQTSQCSPVQATGARWRPVPAPGVPGPERRPARA